MIGQRAGRAGTPTVHKVSSAASVSPQGCRGVTRTWINLFEYPEVPCKDHRAVQRAHYQIDDPTWRKPTTTSTVSGESINWVTACPLRLTFQKHPPQLLLYPWYLCPKLFGGEGSQHFKLCTSTFSQLSPNGFQLIFWRPRNISRGVPHFGFSGSHWKKSCPGPNTNEN